MGEWAMEVAGSPSIVPGVRRWVQQALADLPADVRDRLELIASEYATNCIRHSAAADGGDIRLRLQAAEGVVRIEVHDDGPRHVAPDVWSPDEIPDFGRGLLIVSVLADDMGDESGPDGRLAWAEVKV